MLKFVLLAAVLAACLLPASAQSAVYFDSDFDHHPTDPWYNYRATGGGIQGWGSWFVQNDPDGVRLPGSNTVRKVVRFEVDKYDYGDSHCPKRSRLQAQIGNSLFGGLHPTFGTQFYMGTAYRLPAEFPQQFPPDDGVGLPWLFLGHDHYAPPFAGSSAGYSPKISVLPKTRTDGSGSPAAVLSGPKGFQHPLVRGRWFDVVTWVKESSGVNVADGAVKIWVNTGSGWSLAYSVGNLVTINSAMSSGKIVEYSPKIYYPTELTADFADRDSHCSKTYYPLDPNGTYGWKNRTVVEWATEVRIASTFDEAAPHSYNSAGARVPGPKVFVSDTFSGPEGTLLQNRVGEQAAPWAKLAGYAGDAQVTSDGTLRPSSAGSIAIYDASGSPASADYTVQASLVIRSNQTNDSAAVMSRASTGSGDHYVCRYRVASATTAEYAILKSVSGVIRYVKAKTTGQLAPGAYTIKETDSASSHTCVIGSEVLAGTDASITGPGQAGVKLYRDVANGAPSDSSGVQLDNLSAW